MTPIKVPKDQERGIVSIAKLSDDSVEQLIQALAEAPPTFNPETLADRIAEKIDDVSRDDIDGLVSTLVSLYSALDYFDSSIEQLAANVGRAVVEGKIAGLESSEDALERFRERLIRLLSIDSIGIRSRSINLLLEQDHAFCGARILTDIRPLFAADLTAPPTAGLLVHTLRINYHEGGELKQFFVAMDSKDLEDLRSVLVRADSKAAKLKSVLEAANIPCLDV